MATVDGTKDALGPSPDRSEIYAQKLEDDVKSPTVKFDDEDVDDLVGRPFNVNSAELPSGYYRSPQFVGSMLAIGLSLGCGCGGFSLAAPILSFINADIGPDPNLVWVALVDTLTAAIGTTIVGRLSDLFGRRWFFLGGSVCALIGCIVAATAQSIPVLIGGQTLVGLAASTQLNFPLLVGELVPMKYRFIANAYCYVWIIPFSGFSTAIAYAFIVNTKSGWRWGYYLMIICNAICIPLWYFFYHPPSFHMKHGSGKRLKFIKNFDYLGTFLFTSGMVIGLMGISWGGTVYPWRSGQVIATIIVGAVALIIFGLYEVFAPLTEPLIPIHLFKNRGFTASAIVLSIGASPYYAFTIVWPQMLAALYADGDLMVIGWAGSAIGAGLVVGEIVGGLSAKFIGKTKYQVMTVITLASVILACVATCNPDTKTRAVTLIFFGCCFIGWNECVNNSICSICVDDQREIGSAVGVAQSMRSAISTVIATVYTVILSNRLGKTIPDRVPPALIKAGLPPPSVSGFLTAVQGGSPAAFNAIKGLTPEIQAIGISAYKVACSDAYRTVFLSTIGFSGIAIIASLFVANVDHLMTGEVSSALRDEKSEKIIGKA